jgi:hypothetical protein
MTATKLLTVDQNTGRQVEWVIEGMSEARSTGPATWTHHALLRRPQGRSIYGAMLEIEPATGQVIRNSRPTVAWR